MNTDLIRLCMILNLFIFIAFIFNLRLNFSPTNIKRKNTHVKYHLEFAGIFLEFAGLHREFVKNETLICYEIHEMTLIKNHNFFRVNLRLIFLF